MNTATRYGFEPYEIPRNGLFSVHTGIWQSSGGWENKNEAHLIIGETSDCYIYKLIPSEERRWKGSKVVRESFMLPIGLHKTRLIRWLPTQLQLIQE